MAEGVRWDLSAGNVIKIMAVEYDSLIGEIQRGETEEEKGLSELQNLLDIRYPDMPDAVMDGIVKTFKWDAKNQEN